MVELTNAEGAVLCRFILDYNPVMPVRFPVTPVPGFAAISIYVADFATGEPIPA